MVYNEKILDIKVEKAQILMLLPGFTIDLIFGWPPKLFEHQFPHL